MRKIKAMMWLFVVAGLLMLMPGAALSEEKGKVLYDQWCSSCHGDKGDGKGPAADFVWPKPRDFTKGTYKFKTTASGEPIADTDIIRTIRDGNPGTSMPAFEDLLTSEQIWKASLYIYDATGNKPRTW
jgi:mono/diheme cytochrome c family protein